MELNEAVARVWELLNQEPRYFRELVRVIMDETGMSFNATAELVGDALGILIKEGRVEKVEYVAGKLITSTVWTPYSIYTITGEPPIGWKKYNRLAERKLERLKRLSEVGLQNAELFEKLVYEVVKSIYPDAIKSPFTSSYPDIYVPSKRIVVEATTRFEYPVTANYLKWKYYHIAVPVEKNGEIHWETVPVNEYNPEKPFKMLVVAPAVGPSAWKFIQNQTKPDGLPLAYETRMKLIKVIQFPKTSKAHAGWPLFKKFSYYKKWLEEYHRRVYLISYREAKRKLKQAIRNAFDNWEEQEDVLLQNRTFND